jgi:hypothetical protein
MRAHIAAIIAALAIPCLAHADFEGLLVAKISGDVNGTARTWLSKAGMRSETELTMTAPEARQAAMGKGIHSVTVIKVSEPNRTYFLDENRKTYWVYDAKPGEGSGDDGYTAKRIGKDRVAGFSCEKVVLTSASGRESELCVAPDFVAGDSWLRVLQTREQGKGAGDGIRKALLDAGVKGFPIRWSTKGGKDGRGAFQMELVSAKKQSVPASTFDIPADYRKQEMGMPFASPEAAQKMEEAMKNMTPEQRKQMEEMMKKMGGGKN